MTFAEDRVRIMSEGVEILSPALIPHGFELVFVDGTVGGSGGPSAHAQFVRSDQLLDLHFRLSLGLVSYRWGDTELSHRDYLFGLGAQGSYPGFSDDPLDGFRHLERDLAGPLTGWATGDRAAFLEAAKVASERSSRWLP